MLNANERAELAAGYLLIPNPEARYSAVRALRDRHPRNSPLYFPLRYLTRDPIAEPGRQAIMKFLVEIVERSKVKVGAICGIEPDGVDFSRALAKERGLVHIRADSASRRLIRQGGVEPLSQGIETCAVFDSVTVSGREAVDAALGLEIAHQVRVPLIFSILDFCFQSFLDETRRLGHPVDITSITTYRHVLANPGFIAVFPNPGFYLEADRWHRDQRLRTSNF